MATAEADEIVQAQIAKRKAELDAEAEIEFHSEWNQSGTHGYMLGFPRRSILSRVSKFQDKQNIFH